MSTLPLNCPLFFIDFMINISGSRNPFEIQSYVFCNEYRKLYSDISFVLGGLQIIFILLNHARLLFTSEIEIETPVLTKNQEHELNVGKSPKQHQTQHDQVDPAR